MFRFWSSRISGNESAFDSRPEHSLNSEPLEGRYNLTTYVVNSLGDDNIGLSDGAISLREAIIASNSNAIFGDAPAGSLTGDVIRFAPALAGATITLINGQLDITDDLRIQAGSLNIVIDANSTSRVFNISASQNVSIGGLTITEGAAPNGGGIVASGGGNTTLFRVNLVRNTASATGGGGIWNNGDNLYLTECTLNGNRATGSSGDGGGIYLYQGRVAITDGQLRGNTAVRAGGGIEVRAGQLFTTNALIGGTAAGDANTAGPSGSSSIGNGGGIHVSGGAGTRAAIRGGAIVGNIAAHEGGGLWNPSGAIMMIRGGAVIQANIARGPATTDGGGGIFNNGGTLRIVASTIAGNTALGLAGSGGGIFSVSGNVQIIDSTIRSNQAARAGGGIEIVNGELFLRDSTVGGAGTGNIAGPTGSANPGNGGGIHVSGTNDTRVVIDGGAVSNNTAQTQGGGIWVNNDSRVVVRNSAVVSGNRTLATNSQGGGIYVRGHLQSDQATWTSNIAGQAGGGVFVASNGSANIFSSTLSSNNGGQFGGGLYNEGHVNFSTSTVTNNTVSISGGGVFEEAGAVTNFSATSVVNNTPNNVSS